jgi:hypothetical protein
MNSSISELDKCSFLVITTQGTRNWITLKEIPKLSISTIKELVIKYSDVLEEIKKLPSTSQSKSYSNGYFVNCTN